MSDLLARLDWLDQNSECGCVDGDRTHCPSWIAHDAAAELVTARRVVEAARALVGPPLASGVPRVPLIADLLAKLAAHDAAQPEKTQKEMK